MKGVGCGFVFTKDVGKSQRFGGERLLLVGQDAGEEIVSAVGLDAKDDLNVVCRSGAGKFLGAIRSRTRRGWWLAVVICGVWACTTMRRFLLWIFYEGTKIPNLRTHKMRQLKRFHSTTHS